MFVHVCVAGGPDGSTPKWGPHSQRAGSGDTSTSVHVHLCMSVVWG